MNFNRDTADVLTMQNILEYYIFIDLSTRTFYEYKTFSDTAAIVKQYKQPDTALLHAGVNFYSPKHMDYVSTPRALSDTTIDNIQYKRIRFERSVREYNYSSIGFFRCDTTEASFRFWKYDGEKCPMTRYDVFKTGDQPYTSAEFNFIKTSLTPEEEKVFAAWERNARDGK